MRKRGNRAEATEGNRGRGTLSSTQIQVLWDSLFGWNYPSESIGKCAGTFGRGSINAPLRIFQRILPQTELAYSLCHD